MFLMTYTAWAGEKELKKVVFTGPVLLYNTWTDNRQMYIHMKLLPVESTLWPVRVSIANSDYQPLSWGSGVRLSYHLVLLIRNAGV